MKRSYAIIIKPPEDGEKTYLVYIPDWDIYTQGETMEDCVYMAKDAITLMAADYKEDNKPVPVPSRLICERAENDILAFADVDF